MANKPKLLDTGKVGWTSQMAQQKGAFLTYLVWEFFSVTHPWAEGD